MNEELKESMDKLNIGDASAGQEGPSSDNFKRKPVIIIVVGMAGDLIFLFDFILSDPMFKRHRKIFIWSIEIFMFEFSQGVGKQHFFIGWSAIHKLQIFEVML